MENISKSLPVAINKCGEYNFDSIKKIISEQISALISDESFFKDKNVVIKPNLLMKASPDKSITTHPVVMKAVIEVIKEYCPKSIKLAESPGGPYNTAALGIIYKSTCMTEVAAECGIELNYDTSFKAVSHPEGKVCKVFDIITPIADADVIVNVCKLKTHSLTTMSASVKNLFGTIPGIEKFEMHTRYKELPIFEAMLADLCEMHYKSKPMLCIVDAVKGMEGNGPSGGTIRSFGLLMSSLNPFNLDTACSAVMGVENTVGYIEEGKKKGLCVQSSTELTVIGESINDIKLSDLILPETKSLPILKKLPTLFGGRLNKFLEPKPEIRTNKCIGCGECARSCPAKTISVVKKNNKRIAVIDDRNCIKCYCCQELCPINAVKVKKNIIFKLIK